MKTWIKDCTLIFIIIGTLFGITLAKYPLAAPDGGRYAEIPREMAATGDYLTPHLNGVKYFEKPPLFYWMQAASIKIFGVNDFAVSIVNALLAIGCALFIYITGRKLYGRTQGLISSFIFGTFALVFALTRTITLDVALTFFITGSLCTFLWATQLPINFKRSLYLWASYAFAGCAVMTKGLVGIVFLGLISIIWITLSNEWKNLKNYRIISGLIIFLAITVPWHILVQLKNPEFFDFYFTEQHFLRYATNYAGRSQKWWFFPVLLLVGLYPWTTFFPQAIFKSIPKTFKEWKQPKTTTFLLVWIFIIYIFYTFSNSKLIPYILPIFPPIALLMGNYFKEHWQKTKAPSTSMRTGFIVLSILNIALGTAALVATFIVDFNEQMITKQNLYIISACMFTSAITCQIAYKRNLISGFAAIFIITSILWLYISPKITVINRQSIKPLIITLQKQLQPEDEVISYASYYQDLPFYLQRIITVTNFVGELEFGTKHQDTSKWMISSKEFWKRWNGDKRKYMVVDKDDYKPLQLKAPNKMRIVAKHLDTLLVTNTK